MLKIWMIFARFFRSREWQYDYDTEQMRRWTGSHWEYREATEEERQEAEWWRAIR